MEREQIKKALECCIANDWNNTKCNECPIYNGGGGCIDELKKITIDLINSQEQRIKELAEENERLKATKYMAYSDGRIEMIPTIESVRADTVNKMYLMIKERCIKDGVFFAPMMGIVNLVAEEIIEKTKQEE